MNPGPVLLQLVRHWGEMAHRWGVTRIVAEIHALLYFSAKPLCADDLVEALGVARSHISNGLKELHSWGIVRGVRIPGDRREHFESIEDTWKLFEILLDERKRREVDPTLMVLRDTMAQVSDGRGLSAGEIERLGQMLDFYETIDQWYGEVRRLPLVGRVGLLKLGRKAAKWLK